MHPGQIVRLAMPAILLVATSCGTSRQFFAPTENPIAESASGHTAAEYSPEHQDQKWGEVRVWSAGAETRTEGEESKTLLHVGIEIENLTDQAIELDLERTRIEALQAGERTIDSLEPQLLESESGAAPHGVGEVELQVEVPGGLDATDIDSFRLHWWLVGPDGAEYEQLTPFRRKRRPAYNPWRFGGWPWGYGRFGRGYPFGYRYGWGYGWGNGFYTPWCW